MSRVTVKVGGAEEFFESGRKIAKIADEGRRVPRRHVVAFDDPADLLRVLTPARMALFRAIKLHPGSITAIAERVRRDRSAVTRDVAALGRFGLVRIERCVHPGHGHTKEVSAGAEEIRLEATLR
jgi:predicted transcriptional regulator